MEHHTQQELPELAIERWISPKELAGHFGLREDSAYRWIDDGTIASSYLRFCGRWRIRIHPAAIPALEKIFADSRQ